MKTPSVEPVLKSRLLPQVSFRFFIALTTFCAIIAMVARMAGQGIAIANAAIVGLVFLGICLFMFAALFLIAWQVSLLTSQDQQDPDELEGSPFAEGQLPPQILPPREQRS